MGREEGKGRYKRWNVWIDIETEEALGDEQDEMIKYKDEIMEKESIVYRYERRKGRLKGELEDSKTEM